MQQGYFQPEELVTKFMKSQIPANALVPSQTQANALSLARGSPAYNMYDLMVPEDVIEVFEGDVLKFHSFQTTFKIVVERWQMDNIEKFLFLKSKLKGVALEELPLEADDNAYEKSLENLEKRFNNKRVIIEGCLDRLIAAPTVCSGSAESILNFLHLFRSSLCHLQRFEVTSGDYLVHHTMRTMDADMLKEFEIDLGGHNIMPSSAQLESFLEKTYAIAHRTAGNETAKTIGTT